MVRRCSIMAKSSNHSRPRRKIRRVRLNYCESDAMSDIDSPPPERSLPTRSSLRISSYKESDTDDDESDIISDSSHDDVSSHSRTRSSILRPGPTRTTFTTRSSSHRGGGGVSETQQNTFHKFKRRKVDSRSHSRTKTDRMVQVVIPASTTTSQSCPPWQNLEYQILVKIMRYAAYPLYMNASRATSSISWLLGTSLLCSSFQQACIGALLLSPPLLPSYRVHGLIRLLQACAESYGKDDDFAYDINPRISTDYRVKIKHLEIEVKQLLIRKSGIDLNQLLQHTPLLSKLRLYHDHDEVGPVVWAQPFYSKDKWNYGKLFDDLDEHGIRLDSFEWNGRFLKSDIGLESLVVAHGQHSLCGLKEVAFVNLGVQDVSKEENSMALMRENLLHCLGLLPRLRGLVFRNCNILDSQTVAGLPTGMQVIRFENCSYMTSDGLEQYLSRTGHSVTSMELLGNQALDLGFLATLQFLCPALSILDIDLTFSDPTSYKDTEPLFDELLPNGPPTWPKDMTWISIGPLRNLTADDAEHFYRSILDAATDLHYLRVLKLKTLLKDISWRDRAKMRAKWLSTFEEVFQTKKTYVPVKARTASSEADKKRKSVRLQELEDVSTTESIDDNEESKLLSYRLPRHDGCDIVQFELSDQRPAQEQYREQDFLDEEPSGDEEWNGKDSQTEVFAARRHAW